MKEVTGISGVRSRTLVGGAVASFLVCAALVAACSGADNSGLFGELAEGGAGAEGSVPPGSEGGPGLDGSSGSDAQPCTGAGCTKPTCKDGETTTLRGKVYDPAGVNVLNGVRVFIPSGPLAPLTKGPSCDPCGAISPAPVAATLTNAKGEFELTDVPVGPAVPVVIQTGKWRRAVDVAITKSCQSNDVADRQLRLPKNGSEGDMPQIAVTTGGCDAMECLLRGIGIEDKEFVAGASGGGHVHVFNGEGGNFQSAPSAGGTAANPMGGELWNSQAKMMPYDALLLSCECDESNDNKGGAIGAAGARQALHDYANAGGRVIASHYHYTWFKNSPAMDWRDIAVWNQTTIPASGTFDIDTSFPRGQAFSDWLVAVNASPSGPKTIPLTNVTASLTSINAPAQSWIKKAPSTVAYFSFPTPTVGAACGRVAFTDLHTADINAGGTTFPAGCKAQGVLSEQQKALEFLLFDASSCN